MKFDHKKTTYDRVECIVRKDKYITRAVTDDIFNETPFQCTKEDEKAVVYEGPDNLSQLPRLTDRVTGTAFNAGIGDLHLTRKF